MRATQRSTLRTLAVLLTFAMLATGCAMVAPSGAEQPADEGTSAQPTAVVEEEMANTETDDDAEMDDDAVPTSEPSDEPESAASAAALTFTIDPEQSSARFELDEDLRGNRITVVGTTNQLSGQIFADPADLSAASVGPIEIDAASFVTDSDRRNQAIRRFVLRSSEFDTILFTPTSIAGLPESAAAGDSAAVQIAGDLTIREATLPVTFDASLGATSADEISGSASTVISLADFGLSIPSVPAVANVEEELELYLDFVATAE